MYSYGSPTHGRAKAGRPARTYIQQLCEDTGCCPEDLPRAMNDREEWRERVRDIRAASTIWWWWCWWCPSLFMSTTCLNSKFSFSLTFFHIKFKEHSLTYYSLITCRSKVGFISFKKVLTLCEIQTASFRNWTWIHELTSCNNNPLCLECLDKSLSFFLSFFLSLDIWIGKRQFGKIDIFCRSPMILFIIVIMSRW